MHETQETRVCSPGWEDPLEEEMAACSSSLAWEVSQTGVWQATVHGVIKSCTQVSMCADTHTHNAQYMNYSNL